MMQQVHKKLHPGRALPRSEQELGSVSMVEYLEKSGGYKNQKTLGLIQWILAHAIDAAAQEDFAGMKEIVALLAMSVEQANYDNGDWAVAYLVSLHEDPPIQLFQERSVQVSTTSRPFSPLIPPAWTATTLSYIKDLEVLANKKPDLSKRTGQQQQKEQISETPQSGSPKRKPRYPKRPKAGAEGSSLCQGLVIDDHFAISREPRLASVDKSASFACFQKSQKIYSHHKILGSAAKDVVGLRRSKVIGAELNAGDEAARNRIATLGSPVYAGSARVSQAMSDLGFTVGPPIDIAFSDELDLVQTRVVSWLSYLLTSGNLGSIMVEPVCTTFSRIRRPPLRSATTPLGFDVQCERTRTGNILALRALFLLSVAHRCFIPGLCEQPWTSMMRFLQQWRALEMKDGIKTTRTDSCAFGSPHLKSFRFLSAWLETVDIEKKCDRSHHHIVVEGKYTKASASYTFQLAKAIASCFAASIRARQAALKDLEEGNVRGLENQLVNAVALQAPWREVEAWQYQTKRHINILELKSVLRLAERLVRKGQACRIVNFVDSNVIRCAASKGRSSSRALTPFLCRYGALCIAGGCAVDFLDFMDFILLSLGNVAMDFLGFREGPLLLAPFLIASLLFPSPLCSWQLAALVLGGDAFTLASSISACERASAWHAAWYLLQLSCPQFCSEELCSLVALNSAASAAAKGSEWQLALQDRLLKPDIITYNSLINACANGAQWICALALWSSLPQKISPTMITCSSLLDAFRQSAQWQYALLLVASHRLDMTSYSVAISTCGEAAEWRRGLQLLQDFESVHRPMVIVYNAAISACGGEWLQALGVFNECLKRSLQPDIVTYNALMNVGQKSGRGWEDAIFLLQMAQDATLQPTPSTYTSLFGACRQHGKWRLCLQLLAEAPQSLSTAAYNAAMSCMAENWRHAIGLLEHCPSPDLVTFNALLSAFEKAAQWPRALELLTTSTLRRVALRPDVISFNAAISACEKAEEWPHALHVLSLLRSAALQPTLVSCSATASACEKAGKWQLAGLLLTEVKTMRMQPDLIIYNAAITACEQAGQWQVAFSLLEQAEKSELKPNEITYQAVIVSSERLAWPATLTLLGAAAAADALTPLSVAAALRALREGARFTRASLGPKLLEQLQDRAEVMLIETWPRRDICSRRLLSQRHLSQRAF
ncbi:Pentatricopeptide repeat-containing protein At1g09900 [Durusdinium trenchii]|uniref:Pentatricopeptide repeat-containing protein At1g09900 n=1 Tax=Durusdinium trenchii TaxID=1381693 RepID=A0ABP0J0Y8_9DINO